MDNSTDAKTPCPECGAPATEHHTCGTTDRDGLNEHSATNGNAPDGTEVAEQPEQPRFEIPESLWATGLLKPAFTRAVQESEPVPAGSRGSLFAVEPPVSEPPLETEAPEAQGAPDLAAPEAGEVEDPWAWAEPSREAAAEPDEAEDSQPYDPFEHFGAAVQEPAVDAADAEPEADAEPVVNEEPEADDRSDDVSDDEVQVEEASEPETSEHDVMTIFQDVEDVSGTETEVLPAAAAERFGSADLPASVPFAEATEVTQHDPYTSDSGPVDAGTAVSSVNVDEGDATQKPNSGRKGLLIGALVIAVIVAGVGGWWGWQRQQDSPVRSAFEASHAQFDAGASQLVAATSIAQVALAGEEFAKAVPLLEETADVARERASSYATSARRASLAELEVARAGSALAEVSVTSLGAWSQNRAGLARAADEYAEARSDIQAADGAPTEGLTGELVDSLQQLIGDEVAGGAAENTTELLDRLDTARMVADWRSIGDDAGDLVEPMKAAEQEFAGDDEKAADLASYRRFFSALTGLSSLRPAQLDRWDQVNGRIDTAVAELPTESDRAASLLEDVDGRIVEAREKFTQWESEHAATKAEKEDGLEQLRAAREVAPAVAEEYEALRDELAGIIARGGSFPAEGTEGEAYRVLSASADAHEGLRARLAALPVPSGASSQYAALASVIAEDVTAVRGAADAAAACVEECELTADPAWEALTTRAGASAAAWETAFTAWQAAAEETRTELRAIELPQRPKV